MARLELRRVKQVSRLDVSNKPITIGRSSKSTLVLADTHVSRNHCVIEIVDGHTRIRDLDSHGGTLLNGARITEATLFHGDRISIGPYDLVYKDPLNTVSRPVTIDAVPVVTSNGSVGGTELSDELMELRQLREQGERQHAQAAEQLHSLAEQLKSAQVELDELKSARARLEQERQSSVDDLHAVQAALAEARAQAELARQDLHAKQAELNETTHATQSLQERIDQIQAQSKKDLEQAQRDHAAAQNEIERLRIHESTLQQQVEAVEASRRIAAERAEQASRAMVMLHGQVGSLHDAAGHVASLQERLAQIEIAWGEVDQRLEEVDESDAQALEQAAFERHRISEELESLHQQRDTAVVRLREAAERLRSLTEAPIVRVVNSAASAHRTGSGRRWWKFGK